MEALFFVLANAYIEYPSLFVTFLAMFLSRFSLTA